MIDTHAHLDACADGPDDVLERARAAGVDRVVGVGTSLESCTATLAIAARHEGVYAALGIHPHQAGEQAGDLDAVGALFADAKAVAVGETGLDFFRDWSPPAAQRVLFQRHLDLAREVGKPVVIHSRAADAEVAEILEPFEGPVILHCFSSRGLLQVALDRGYYVSFAGNVTFPNAKELRVAAAQVRDDRLLVETDSPYLAPQAVRGRTNEPAYVAHTVASLAETRGVDMADLAEQIDANASEVFGLP
jgi:TatD DNase family protein